MQIDGILEPCLLEIYHSTWSSTCMNAAIAIEMVSVSVTEGTNTHHDVFLGGNYYVFSHLTWPMAKLSTFWDYIFSRENKVQAFFSGYIG